MKLNIVVSDYTYMKDTYCIAGWSPSEQRMRRLMPNGHHWSEAESKKVEGHSCIQVETMSIPPEEGRDYPHKKEDTWISENIIPLYHYDTPADLAYELEGSLSKNIASVFSGHLKDNSYVLPGTKCASLGAIKVPAQNLEFYKDSENKLRIKIRDNDGEKYDLRITCRYLRDVLDKMNGLKKLNEQLKGMTFAHVRVGLAKPYYKQNNHCFLMCNGVFLY